MTAWERGLPRDSGAPDYTCSLLVTVDLCLFWHTGWLIFPARPVAMLTPLINITPFRHLFRHDPGAVELLTYLASDVVMPGHAHGGGRPERQPQLHPPCAEPLPVGGAAAAVADRPAGRPLRAAPAAAVGVRHLRPGRAWPPTRSRASSCSTCCACCRVSAWALWSRLSYPALNEAFSEADAVRMMALLANIALLSPLLGPLVGTLLLEWVSWRWLFVTVRRVRRADLVRAVPLHARNPGRNARDGTRLAFQPIDPLPLLAGYGSCWATAASSPAALPWAWWVCR